MLNFLFILFVLILLFCFWCCLKVASITDDNNILEELKRGSKK